MQGRFNQRKPSQQLSTYQGRDQEDLIRESHISSLQGFDSQVRQPRGMSNKQNCRVKQ